MNKRMTTTVEAALKRTGLLERGATLLVALSGGADSVTLLRTLCALAPKYGLTVCAAHVEHGLRAEASLKDAEFCHTLCTQLAVPFTCDHAVLEGDMCAPGAEARARDARYRLLFARARECGADALLLAHHQDDQAETMLAHLVRGGGARGLGGMREEECREGIRIVRPLLGVSKHDILEALAGLPYREDESNALPCCQRNRLRAEVVPLLMRENPRAVEHMAQSAALLAMDDAYLQVLAHRLLARTLMDRPPYNCVSVAPLAAAPQAVAVRALRTFALRGVDALCAQNGNTADVTAGFPPPLPQERALSADDSLRLLMLLHAKNGQTLNLPMGVKALKTPRFIHLVRMADGSPLVPAPRTEPQSGLLGRKQVRMGGCTFALSRYDPQTGVEPDGITSIIVPDTLMENATLRAALPGDVIHPFGASGSKPLRRYFTDQKVDAPFRPNIPLLCVNGEALWVCGVGAGEATRLTRVPSTLVKLQSRPPWLP
jgi:tRNA(Ile)-lysidine synthase